MKALLCEKYGPPESLTLGELAQPTPADEEVLIKVHACGINFPDLLIIEDKYQFHPPLPFSPGGEVSGEIVSCGSAVRGLQAGDRVIAMTTAHGLQEYTCAHYLQCLPIPPSMDFATAASFSITYGTAWHALMDRAHIQSGETLLVLGASGGVGTATLDIARNLGVRCIAAGGDDNKLEKLRELYGVEEFINYNKLDGNFKDAVNAMTDGKGVDVIFDPVGGELFQQCMRCINWNGRILVVGFASDGENLPLAKTNLLLLKGSALLGVFWGRFAKDEAAKNISNFKKMFALHAEGKLAPHISHQFPLEQGISALQTLRDRKVIGKCVVTMS